MGEAPDHPDPPRQVQAGRPAGLLFDLLLFTNLWIALAAVAMVWVTEWLLGGEARIDALSGLVFFAALAVYNTDRLSGDAAEDQADASPRHVWVQRREVLLLGLLVGSAAGVLALLPLMATPVLLAMIPLAALSAAYSLPLLRPLPCRANRLKEVSGLKTLLVPALWAAATVGLPALAAGRAREQTLDVLLLGVERFVFLAAITLPFDLRDVARDAAAGIRTLPMQLGAQGTRRMSVLLAVLFSGLCLMHWSAQRPRDAGALVLAGLATAAVLGRLNTARGDWYYHFLLDGTMMLQAALVWVL